jgi:hypothetical protein
MTLARDVGLASLPLSVERIEFLLEALVGRFSGVDRAADGGPGSCEISLRHRPPPPLSENPARTQKIAFADVHAAMAQVFLNLTEVPFFPSGPGGQPGIAQRCS